MQRLAVIKDSAQEARPFSHQCPNGPSRLDIICNTHCQDKKTNSDADTQQVHASSAETGSAPGSDTMDPASVAVSTEATVADGADFCQIIQDDYKEKLIPYPYDPPVGKVEYVPSPNVSPSHDGFPHMESAIADPWPKYKADAWSSSSGCDGHISAHSLDEDSICPAEIRKRCQSRRYGENNGKFGHMCFAGKECEVYQWCSGTLFNVNPNLETWKIVFKNWERIFSNSKHEFK